MNILFVNKNDISPQRGGIERITEVLSTYFIDIYKYKCFLSYYYDLDNNFQQSYFCSRDKLLYGKEEFQLLKFISRHEIDVVIVQQLPELVQLLSQIRNCTNRNYRIFYVQHDYLSVNLTNSNYNYITFLCKYGSTQEKIKSYLKLMFFFIYSRYTKYILINKIRPACDIADKIIILSSKFLPYGKNIIGEKNLHKVYSIGNCLTFKDSYKKEYLYKKRRKY